MTWTRQFFRLPVLWLPLWWIVPWRCCRLVTSELCSCPPPIGMSVSDRTRTHSSLLFGFLSCLSLPSLTVKQKQCLPVGNINMNGNSQWGISRRTVIFTLSGSCQQQIIKAIDDEVIGHRRLSQVKCLFVLLTSARTQGRGRGAVCLWQTARRCAPRLIIIRFRINRSTDGGRKQSKKETFLGAKWEDTKKALLSALGNVLLRLLLLEWVKFLWTRRPESIRPPGTGRAGGEEVVVFKDTQRRIKKWSCTAAFCKPREHSTGCLWAVGMMRASDGCLSPTSRPWWLHLLSSCTFILWFGVLRQEHPNTDTHTFRCIACLFGHSRQTPPRVANLDVPQSSRLFLSYSPYSLYSIQYSSSCVPSFYSCLSLPSLPSLPFNLDRFIASLNSLTITVCIFLNLSFHFCFFP